MVDDASLSPPPLEHRSSTSSTVSSVSSLEDKQQLGTTALVPLHGVTMTKLLSNKGEAFYYKQRTSRIRQRRESQLLYNLSEPVEELDEFISHSWNADPQVAVWTMKLRVNFWLAVIISIITTITMSWLFRIESRITTIVGILLYVILLARGQDIPLKLPCVRRTCDKMVFFDRCCIDQVDPIRKVAGIKSIGAYLNKCDSFLVLWSDDYFQRLWCVFELACFLKGSETMSKQRPLKLFMMPIQKSVFRCMFLTTAYWLLLSVSPRSLRLPLDVIMSVALLRFVILGDLGERMKMRYALSEIDFETVQCTESSDKEMIIDLIEEWYGSLEKFKSYVSDKMCHAAKEAVSTDRLMIHICCVSQPAILYGLAHKDMLQPALYACRGMLSLVAVIYISKRFGMASNEKQAVKPNVCRIIVYIVSVLVSIIVDVLESRWIVIRSQQYFQIISCVIGAVSLLVVPAITFSSTASAVFGDRLDDRKCWRWLVDECSL
ncbi:hypothetical protein FOL47_001182 [Perkinsus chesapeaki]|uniref:Uncharacterized protein n=2 Tax=Alveolata TaxID=33630 RepID=A0A7J6MJN0_PERCH|nr:hypothetical protein FOL47_001182 [Perkinsus chesapeaki]